MAEKAPNRPAPAPVSRPAAPARRPAPPPVAATSSGPAPDITPFAVVLALGGGLAAWRKNQTDAEEAAVAADAAAAAAPAPKKFLSFLRPKGDADADADAR